MQLKARIGMSNAMSVYVYLCLCLISLCSVTHSENRRSRAFSLTCEVTVKEIPKGTKLLNLWVPFPKEDEHQEILDYQITSPFPYGITEENQHCNRMVHIKLENPQTDLLSLLVNLKVIWKSRPKVGRAERM